MTAVADTSKLPTTVESYAAQELARQVHRVADRVDDLAETIRRRAADVDNIGGPGRPNYAGVVRDVVHEVHTVLMNLGLGSLSTAAATADIARAKGE